MQPERCRMCMIRLIALELSSNPVLDYQTVAPQNELLCLCFLKFCDSHLSRLRSEFTDLLARCGVCSCICTSEAAAFYFA